LGGDQLNGIGNPFIITLDLEHPFLNKNGERSAWICKLEELVKHAKEIKAKGIHDLMVINTYSSMYNVYTILSPIHHTSDTKTSNYIAFFSFFLLVKDQDVWGKANHVGTDVVGILILIYYIILYYISLNHDSIISI
jgi:hypothetical protein